MTVTGLGYLFSDNFKAKLLKIILGFFIKHFINKNFDFLMFQNSEDQKTFINYSKYQGESYIIPTSGIETKEIKIISARNVILFKPSKYLREFINSKNE